MKTTLKIYFGLLAVLLLFSACNKDDDTQPPKIDLISPVNCDSVLLGDFIEFKAIFSDETELWKYAVEVVNNFDHISYGQSDQGCPKDPEKTPVNAFKYVTVNDIPPGLTEFEKSFQIATAESVDKGDYLLIVYAQDKKGHQSFYSISLKLYNTDIE